MVNGRARWTPRDWFAAAGLFLATASVVFRQNAHVAVLWDLSYTLDSAARIAQGQLPYRDFPFAHAPLTFLIQAAIIRLTGRVFFHHVVYAAIVGGLGTVLAWRIALRSLVSKQADRAWLVSLLLAAPLSVLGIYCILPFPSYDCDCAFALLIAIYLLQKLSHDASSGYAFLTGAALCLPLFFKQNIGLPFLAIAVAILFVPLTAAFLSRGKSHSQNRWGPLIVMTCAGIAATLLAALLLLHFTVGIGNYFHWTIQFAAQRRLPGLQQMLGIYQEPQLLWALPCIAASVFLLHGPPAKHHWAQAVGAALMAAPFIYTLCTLFIYDDADERGDSLLALWPMLLILAIVLALRELLPRRLRKQTSLQSLLLIPILAAIHGALMSQQLWGSTYAIWPLLILLVAEMLAYLRSQERAIAFTIAATFLICGGFYTASEERLSYAQLPEGPVQHSTFPQLKGLSIAGTYIDDFDELLHYADAHIPISDGLILLPGEDPFYFVTGRTPQFPVLLFDPATDPLSPEQVVQTADEHRIRWLIVKLNLQLTADPMPQRDTTLKLLMDKFKLTAHLHAYDIYERR
jgi:hypothetical protein